MHSFEHGIAALRLVAGSGALARLGAECDRLGAARVALVCSASVARDAALMAQVEAALGARLAGSVTDVPPHSPLPSVEAAAAALRAMAADGVVALGGGSVIVTARAAVILLAEGRAVRELCTRIDGTGRLISPRLLAPKLPMIVVPATPTTAAAKAGAAVHDPATGQRLALYDPASRARTMLLAPEAMTNVPGAAVLAAGLNALAMAIEGLMAARPSSALADAALIHALRLIPGALRPAVLANDADARIRLAEAAVLVGQGSDYTGGGVVSALGHAIGPRHGAANGIVNAVILPAALRFNAGHAGMGLAKVTLGLGLPPAPAAAPDPEPVIAALRALCDDLSVPRRLGDLGLTRADLAPLAAAALQDWFLRGNPRPITEGPALEALLAEVL